MNKAISSITLALGLAAVSTTGAEARDYNWTSRNDCRNDYRAIERSAAQVREEREELEAARHKLHWALRSGDEWGARKAAHELREEQEELAAARNRFQSQRRDVDEDRYEHYGAWRPVHRWHHWW